MPNAVNQSPTKLLDASVKLKVFLVLRHTRDPQRMKEMLSEHLRWIAGKEREGSVFLSGPVTADGGGSRPDGLTVLRISDIAAAEALIREDPLVAAGVVTVDVCEWTLNEGSLKVTLNLSEASFSFS